MTYHSRGRSLTEVITAVVFSCFLIGFIGVLCIGNYFRAKRAMVRQKERRMARRNAAGIAFPLHHHDGADMSPGRESAGGVTSTSSSPRSSATSGGGSDEHLHLLHGQKQKLPELPRRRMMFEDAGASGDLLMNETVTTRGQQHQQAATTNVMSV